MGGGDTCYLHQQPLMKSNLYIFCFWNARWLRHKIIFELEKAKIIDEKNYYKQQKRLRNDETRNVLESIENAYKDRINLLKENLQKKRQERQIAQLEQREVTKSRFQPLALPLQGPSAALAPAPRRRVGAMYAPGQSYLKDRERERARKLWSLNYRWRDHIICND